MDISETYIKMCDCPEMKKEHKKFEIPRLSIPVTGGNFYGYKNSSDQDDLATVWLPRQDQIQEMLEKYYTPIEGVFHHFHLFLEDDGNRILLGWGTGYSADHFLTSREQLWLVFYMFKEHGKIWDGKNWIKVKNIKSKEARSEPA